MSDATAEFFAGISRRGFDPLLQRTDEVLRFDLSAEGHTEHWMLTVARGNIKVSHEERDADCVVSGSRGTFDRIARGETRLTTAWLRNQIAVEGRLYPLVLMERLLPDKPGAHDPRALVAPYVAAPRQVGERGTEAAG